MVANRLAVPGVSMRLYRGIAVPEARADVTVASIRENGLSVEAIF
jgi:hypothetical protein